MKKLSLNLSSVLYYIILALPLILTRQISALGDNILPLMIIVLEVFLICKRILDSKGKRFIIRKYPMDKYICYFILIFSLWKILSFLLGIFSSGLLDMEFYTTILAITVLYLLMDFPVELHPNCSKVATVCGTIGSFIVFLTCIKETELNFFIDALTVTNDGIISYLLLVNVLSIANYILLEKVNKWSEAWLIPVAFNMFVMLLKQSHIANWIIVFLLLTVAAFFRPRASLIKKVGTLLFLFLFLWSNMSLVLNYTQWFQVEAIYSLEASVYMELFLALGGLLFFHFWDKLPENIDLHKISMVKMQVYFRMILGILVFIFLIFVTGGTVWQVLPEEGVKDFVRALALPLSSEITAGSSTIFTWILELGVVNVILILTWFYQLGLRLYKRCGIDWEKNNFFFLIYIVFLIEIFIWELPCNVLIICMFLISMGNMKPKLIEIELEDESEKSGGESDEKV